jgi:hypothetical protein
MFSSAIQFKGIRTDGSRNMTDLVVNVCCVTAFLKLDSVGSCQMEVSFIYFENTTCYDAHFGYNVFRKSRQL